LRWEIVWRNAPPFGETLDLRCHFKHVSLKQSRFYHCQTSTPHKLKIKVDGNVATISIKISLSVYTWCIFTFRTSVVSCYFWKHYEVLRTIHFNCWDWSCIISVYRNLLCVTKGWLSILRQQSV
jgi:hypothetical protein